MGQLRFFTVLLLTLAYQGNAADDICNVYCDGRDPSLVSSGVREAATKEIDSRKVTLFISDTDNMAYATISNGEHLDEIWIDRSFDAGLSWDDGSLLGFTSIPQGSQETSTLMYNVDKAFNGVSNPLGAVRACGRPFNPGFITCTDWYRSTVMAETPIDAAATALMQFHDGTLWNTVGWWNGANVFTALMQYMRLTQSSNHLHVIQTTFEKNINDWDGNFTSDALDDTEWWALAWVEAYDVTGDNVYLEMAKFDADYILQYVDNVCGGGVWWNIYKTYKNAITNELLIQLTAALHNRIPGDTKYLNHALELWTWFKQSGMINQDNLINDGLRDDCSNNQDTTWTYNQGVILGALVELYKATGDESYLEEARLIADAVVNSPHLSREGILTEPCEGSGPVECGDFNGGCDCNAISFKGIFMRHLGDLNRNLASRPYQIYIDRQKDAIYQYNRNALNQYGVHYAGPFEDANAGTTQSCLEVFTASISN